MNDRKKILFLNARLKNVQTFWNDVCVRKAAEYGFDIDIPARDGDVEDFDWGKILPRYDALITTWNSPLCSAAFLASAPGVRVIGHSAGSVAQVTDATTFGTGVRVTTANPLMAEAVAEWSLLATLLAQRRLETYACLHPGEKMDWNAMSNIADLHKMVIGLWGMGDVTKHLLRLLGALRPAEILVCSSHASEEELARHGAKKASLDELLTRSDIFHCLVGVNSANLYRIGEREFAMMKENAVFVNAGRAKLCREEALLKALSSGRIRAILDVFHEEPLPEDSPLYALPNVLMTPHDAGYTGRDRFLPFILDEFHRFFTGVPMEAEITPARRETMTHERLG
ncbi:MAG: hydroxyacid dehydrogenase [Lentisphaeria bacterium]|nr:hydroxyacid dehydrogenase [Lentisphaeria bacterium]